MLHQKNQFKSQNALQLCTYIATTKFYSRIMRIDTLWSCVALEVIGFRCKISVALDNIKNISSCIRNAFVKQNICFSSDMQKYRIFHSFTSANGMLSPWQRYRCRNSRRAKIEFLVLMICRIWTKKIKKKSPVDCSLCSGWIEFSNFLLGNFHFVFFFKLFFSRMFHEQKLEQFHIPFISVVNWQPEFALFKGTSQIPLGHSNFSAKYFPCK